MTARADVKVPTVHLNGSSPEVLELQLLEARTKIREAWEALEHAAPNARDYYVQGDEAFRQARADHVSRVQRLMAVEQELAAIFRGVRSQVDERERHRARHR